MTNRWIFLYRLAWGLAIVLFLTGLVCVFFVPEYHRIQELVRRKSRMQEENRDLGTAINDLRTRQERFYSDPAFVERTARENGMVKPGETILRFTNELSSPLQVP